MVSPLVLRVMVEDQVAEVTRSLILGILEAQPLPHHGSWKVIIDLSV